ncbi:MAG: 2'-5' RNA ligase family protein [Candidatus Saccharibacteria bacterium]
MSLVVIAYPKISQADLDWVQSVRKEKDKLNYMVIEPHFTFVFPVANVDEQEFISHVREKAKDAKAITFTLNKTKVVKDSFNEYWHTFLVPSEGYDEIVKLHDLLYTGSLQKELRLDIPFVPHVGIGSDVDPEKMKQLEEELKAKGLHISGVVDELAIASFDGKSVKTISTIQLQ